MKIALIGAGRIGRYHAGILADLVGGSNVAVTDIDADRARSVADEIGGRFAPTSEEAIDGVDALAIASATNVHAANLRLGADAGLPMFCEKPIALDLAESRAVVEYVEAKGVAVQLGFQRRFDPAYREARRLIESGEIGTVYTIRLAGHDPAPPHEDYIPASGGLLRDFSIHDFDLIRFLTGSEVDEIYALGAVRGSEVFAKYGDVDTAVATLRMADGILAVLTVARQDPLGYDIRTEIMGSKDSVSVGLGPQMPLRSLEPGVPPPAGPAWANFIKRFDQAYRDELAYFLRVAAGEVPSPCTLRDGLEALRVSEAGTISLHEHRPVRVPDVTA